MAYQTPFLPPKLKSDVPFECIAIVKKLALGLIFPGFKEVYHQNCVICRSTCVICRVFQKMFKYLIQRRPCRVYCVEKVIKMEVRRKFMKSNML